MKNTVYREGDRIRASDGTGYHDRVSDDTILEHIRTVDTTGRTWEFVAFAEAVLAIRAFERAAPPVVMRSV